MSGGPYTYVGLRPEEVQRLARELQAAGWVRKLPTTDPHQLLRAEADGAEFTLWPSGKFAYRGPRARQVLEELVRQAGIVAEGGPTEVGSDEAGKGEWLGPMVVAAAAIRPEKRLMLKLDGVRDSKDIGGPLRHRLAAHIRQHAAAYNVVVIGPKRFNELWDPQARNLNPILWWAHRTALEPVLAKVRDDPELLVVLDEFDRTRQAAQEFRAVLPPKAAVRQRPRAEEALAVAAASVLARAERDRQVELLVEKWGLTLDMRPEAARAHPQRGEFAKVAYLKEPKA